MHATIFFYTAANTTGYTQAQLDTLNAALGTLLSQVAQASTLSTELVKAIAAAHNQTVRTAP
jgi:hypothetical protein